MPVCPHNYTSDLVERTNEWILRPLLISKYITWLSIIIFKIMLTPFNIIFKKERKKKAYSCFVNAFSRSRKNYDFRFQIFCHIDLVLPYFCCHCVGGMGCGSGHNEDSDQTGRMLRLPWVFADCTCHFVCVVVLKLKCKTSYVVIDDTHSLISALNVVRWLDSKTVAEMLIKVILTGSHIRLRSLHMQPT